jgi:hypothetical protein
MPIVGTAVFALVVIVFVAVSRRVGRLHLTAPIVFTGIGYVASLLVDTTVDAALIRSIAEATLAVVLFHDAAQVRPAQLRGDVGLCLRLLLVGLPLTILLGVGAAQVLLPSLGFAFLLLLASALAPTDAGLGAESVVSFQEQQLQAIDDQASQAELGAGFELFKTGPAAAVQRHLDRLGRSRVQRFPGHGGQAHIERRLTQERGRADAQLLGALHRQFIAQRRLP